MGTISRATDYSHTVNGLLQKRADLFNEAERLRDRLAEIKNDASLRSIRITRSPCTSPKPGIAAIPASTRRRSSRMRSRAAPGT